MLWIKYTSSIDRIKKVAAETIERMAEYEATQSIDDAPNRWERQVLLYETAWTFALKKQQETYEANAKTGYISSARMAPECLTIYQTRD